MRQFVVLGFLAVASVSNAEVVWRGDFESGTLKQWYRQQAVSADRIQLVSDTVREGRYAVKVTVQQGDNPIKASGNRNELVALTHEAPGSEYYYKWSTMFAPDFPIVNKWQLFAQWHQEGGSGSPPVEFYVIGNQLRLRVGGGSGKVVWTAPMVRGEWNDFVFHVKWSSKASEGFVELFHNGKLALAKTFLATQFVNDVNYLKLGLYRDATIKEDGVVYHDGMMQTTALEDVMPPKPTSPSSPITAGTPSADEKDTTPKLTTDHKEDAEPESKNDQGLDVADATAVGCSSAPSDSGGPSLWLGAFGVFALALTRASSRRCA